MYVWNDLGTPTPAHDLEEVIKVVGVAAVTGPVTISLWAGMFAGTTEKIAPEANVVGATDAGVIDPVAMSLMAGTSLEEATEAVGVVAVCDPDANTGEVTISSTAGTSSATGTLMVWPAYRL